MRYANTIKWLHAIWDVNSPEAKEVVDEVVEGAIDSMRTHATMVIHLKGGRSIKMRAWVDKRVNITEHELWKGMTNWLNDPEDNTPYSFYTDDNDYNTHIVKSEIVQLELIKGKNE